MTSEINWNVIGYIVSSKYRVMVIKHLQSNPKTPTQISRSEKTQISHISRALQQLREKDLVELLVSEEQKKGRIYSTTGKGNNAWEKMVSNDMETLEPV